MIKHKKNSSNESEENGDLESTPVKDTDTEPQISEIFDNKDNDKKSETDNKENESSKKQETESELEKKIKEIETLTDTMKRRQADFENYKKRMIKMQEEQKKLAIKDFALDVININDDLLRAREAACNVNNEQTVAEVCSSFADGFSMISKKIEETLQKYGIEEIDSLNKAFDPNYNEAVEIDESEDVEFDTITQVHQKGFRLDEYIVRAAKVKVTKPKIIPGSDSVKNDKNIEDDKSNNNEES